MATIILDLVKGVRVVCPRAANGDTQRVRHEYQGGPPKDLKRRGRCSGCEEGLDRELSEGREHFLLLLQVPRTSALPGIPYSYDMWSKRSDLTSLQDWGRAALDAVLGTKEALRAVATVAWLLAEVHGE